MFACGCMDVQVQIWKPEEAKRECCSQAHLSLQPYLQPPGNYLCLNFVNYMRLSFEKNVHSFMYTLCHIYA